TRPLHPVAARRGDQHRAGVADRVPHDHPVAFEPAARQGRRAGGEPLPAGVRARDPLHLRAATGPRAAAAGPHPGARRRVRPGVASRTDDARIGQLFVLLDHYEPGRTPRLLDSLRARLAAYPGAEIALREFENGPPIDAPIALRIEGTSLDTLHAIAARVERLLKATPGTQYVTNPVRVA